MAETFQFTTRNPRPRPKLLRKLKLSLRCLLVLVVSVLSVGARKVLQELPACRVGTGFDRAAIWGTGLDGAEVSKRECFLILPKDAAGNRVDQNCSPPSTFWLVFLQSTDGSVRLMADVFHIPSEGFHQVCYKIMEPGQYTISINLVATSFAEVLTRRNVSVEEFPNKLVKETSIVARVVDLDRHKASLAALPPCTLEILSKSNNEGRWIDDLWYPNDCRVNRITPREALQCLDDKRLLIAGDSQMWALFAELMNFLGKADRCEFFEEYKKDLLASASLRAYKARLKGPIPYIPGSEDIAVHTTEYGRGALATYYGTASNGFGIGRVQVDAHNSKGVNDSEAVKGYTLKVTYVSHSDSGEPLFRPWMTDYTRTGPLANTFAPFDYVLATSGLHDLALYDTAAEYAANLNSEFVPSLRFVVRNMSVITWAGLWSAQEAIKSPRYLPMSNNARGFALDDVARRRVTTAWGIKWLGMGGMTAPRKDLCHNSAHYSWPVSMATIELWLGCICPPSQGWEPDSFRC